MPARRVVTNINPQPIRGGKFTFRTFAGGHFGSGQAGLREGGWRGQFIDRLVTVTMPAIDGEKHKIIPHMEVQL